MTLLVATGNAHKVGEIRAGLGMGFAVLSQRDLGMALEPVEDGTTFAANAAIKSVTWAAHLSAVGEVFGIDYVLADDSGLEVDALGGAPGVHSARFAALDDGRPGNSADAENNAKLLRLLAGVGAPELYARTRWFEGTCEGRIRPQAAGVGGFGYDPLFVPTGENRSFAELGEVIKNRLSHRGRALAALRAHGDFVTPMI